MSSKVIEGAYEKFNAGDIEGLVDLMAEDVEWVLPEISGISFSGARKGRTSVRAVFDGILGQQEPINFDVDGMIAQGDRVVAFGQYTWQVKATGRRYAAHWAHIWTVTEGKITRFQEYTDSAAAAAAYAN